MSDNQRKQIDTLLYGKAVAKNMVLYSLYNGEYCREAKDDPTAHFPDFTAAVSKSALDKLRKKNRYVSYVPGNALSGSETGLVADLKKAWEKTGKHPIEQWKYFKTNPDGTKQHYGPQYSSKYDHHLSISYSIANSNISTTESNNLKIKIKSRKYVVDGYLKIKGWNQKIRFDEDYKVDFLDYITGDLAPNYVQIRILRDLDRYYIIFLLKNVYVPYKKNEKLTDHIGIDVGEITLAALSDGTKYDGIFEHNPEYQKILDSIDHINQQMSKQWGYRNPKFREQRKKNHSLKPSKQYMRSQKRYRRLYNKRNDMLNTYQHEVLADITKNTKKINAETLCVTDMFWYKEKQIAEQQERKDEKTDCAS